MLQSSRVLALALDVYVYVYIRTYVYVRTRLMIISSTKSTVVSGNAPRAHCAPQVCLVKATFIAVGTSPTVPAFDNRLIAV